MPTPDRFNEQYDPEPRERPTADEVDGTTPARPLTAEERDLFAGLFAVPADTKRDYPF